MIAVALDNQGEVALKQGMYQQARESLEHSLQICYEIQDINTRGEVLRDLGELYHHQGDWQQAETYFAAGLEVFDHLGKQSGVAKCLKGWSEVHMAQGRLEQAAQFLSRVAAIYESIGRGLPPELEQAKQAIQNVLDGEQFIQAWHVGSTMPLDDLLEQGKSACKLIEQTFAV
jgi:tetratricopeptide (TPR) repeat protein